MGPSESGGKVNGGDKGWEYSWYALFIYMK
jgi:hypothetical protein